MKVITVLDYLLIEPPRGIIVLVLTIGSAVCNSYTTITRDLS